MDPAIDARWYRSLRKPFFTPPPFVFSIVWPILYMLLAVLFVAHPSWLFVGHLVLNLSWSPVFFQQRRPAWALLVLTGMVVTALFLRRRLPWTFDLYLTWILFAWTLNAGIVWLN